MNNTIKYILVGVIAVISIALIADRFMRTTEPSVPRTTTATTSPFDGLSLRYNGYYRNQIGDLLYLIRFFPEGRVVTVNGTTEVEKDLPKFLVRETQGNPALGLHNVRVQVLGDSMVFVTRPEKGEIEYRGAVASNSMVRFVRHSHITGTRQMMEYVFYPDSTASQ